LLLSQERFKINLLGLHKRSVTPSNQFQTRQSKTVTLLKYLLLKVIFCKIISYKKKDYKDNFIKKLHLHGKKVRKYYTGTVIYLN